MSAAQWMTLEILLKKIPRLNDSPDTLSGLYHSAFLRCYNSTALKVFDSYLHMIFGCYEWCSILQLRGMSDIRV